MARRDKRMKRGAAGACFPEHDPDLVHALRPGRVVRQREVLRRALAPFVMRVFVFGKDEGTPDGPCDFASTSGLPSDGRGGLLEGVEREERRHALVNGEPLAPSGGVDSEPLVIEICAIREASVEGVEIEPDDDLPLRLDPLED